MQKATITLYSCSDGIRSALRTAFKGAAYDLIEITDSAHAPRAGINEVQQPGTVGRLDLPLLVDGVVSTSGLNSATEGLAATLALKQNRNDVYVYVLPEAMNPLRDKLTKLGDMTLVGGDQSR